MKLLLNMLAATLLVLLMSLSAQAGEKAATDEKPVVHNVALLSFEATVESIDREKRQVTLKNAEGESHTFTLEEEAGKLDDIEPGDLVNIDYLESVSIEVFGPGELEAGTTSEAVVAESKPGEKPAGLAAGQTSVVVTIEGIDLEDELVTLKGKDGQSKTVKPLHPENLKKVKVGDMVRITYTQAVGFSVTEKPAEKK